MPEEGLEPPTYRLQGGCSTFELFRPELSLVRRSAAARGAPQAAHSIRARRQRHLPPAAARKLPPRS